MSNTYSIYGLHTSREEVMRKNWKKL